MRERKAISSLPRMCSESALFIILKANGKQMHSVQDLENAMKTASQSPDQVLFMTGVYPSGKQGYYAVDLSQE